MTCAGFSWINLLSLKRKLMHKRPSHYPISTVIRYFSLWADVFLSLLSHDQSTYGGLLWEWGQMFWQLKRGSANTHVHTHVHMHPLTQIECMHPGAHMHSGKFFRCVGEFKAEDLKDKKAAVTYLQSKCSYMGKHEKQCLHRTSHEKLPLFHHYMKTLCLSIVEIIKWEALFCEPFISTKGEQCLIQPITLFHRRRKSSETHHLLKYVTQLWTNQVEEIFWIWCYYHVIHFSQAAACQTNSYSR